MAAFVFARTATGMIPSNELFYCPSVPPIFSFLIGHVFSENHKWRSFGFITGCCVLWLELNGDAVLFLEWTLLSKYSKQSAGLYCFYSQLFTKQKAVITVSKMIVSVNQKIGKTLSMEKD